MQWFLSPKTKSVTVSIVSPSICHEVMGPDVMILVFWMLSFKPTFSLSSFTFKRFFSPSSLSAKRAVLSVYLRVLLFLPAILTPAGACSSPAFLMMYSAYTLNKQGDNIQPWCAPFWTWNQSVVPCPVLTAASWPAYRWGYWKLPDGRDWLRGKLGLVLMGEALLSKSVIQSSVDGLGCFYSLFLDLRPHYGGGNEDNLLQKVPCSHCCTQCPQTCRPPPTHTLAGDSWTLMD